MKDLKFTSTHEWLKREHDEVAIGITEHAQQLLGDIVYVELPEMGSRFSSGDELGVVESVKAASDFYAPISGIVTAVNEALVEKPELVNQSPYSLGWLVKMKPEQINDMDALLSMEQYQTEIAEDN